MSIRIGMGYDVHQLRKDYQLWIGGLNIPFEKGSVGHSDGDVLIHAICDALLGALNLNDIGHHFPDTDPTLKAIDSKILLTRTMELIRDKNYDLGNLDATVCLQEPKLSPHIGQMQEILASVMNVNASQVSIKATTTERMGFVGTGDGISAYAVVLLTKK
jgi:2-C-methyl-D-erythritol 2,4-cyclodiphosphate synthase